MDANPSPLWVTHSRIRAIITTTQPHPHLPISRLDDKLNLGLSGEMELLMVVL